MSPTSIVLCMAACFVGLVAALIVVNRFGSMSTRKLVVIAMMVAVYVVLNTVGTIRLGWINISVSALPIIVGILSGVYSANMINGYVCQTGKKHGIPTPFNDKVVEIVEAIGAGKLPLAMSNLDLFDPSWFPYEFYKA